MKGRRPKMTMTNIYRLNEVLHRLIKRHEGNKKYTANQQNIYINNFEINDFFFQIQFQCCDHLVGELRNGGFGKGRKRKRKKNKQTLVIPLILLLKVFIIFIIIILICRKKNHVIQAERDEKCLIQAIKQQYLHRGYV